MSWCEPISRAVSAFGCGVAILWRWLGEGDARKPRLGKCGRVLGPLMEWRRISSGETENLEKNNVFYSNQSWVGFISIFCRFALFSASAFHSLCSCICSFFFLSSCGFEGLRLFYTAIKVWVRNVMGGGKKACFSAQLSPFQVKYLMLPNLHPSLDQGLHQRCSRKATHICRVLVLVKDCGCGNMLGWHPCTPRVPETHLTSPELLPSQ